MKRTTEEFAKIVRQLTNGEYEFVGKYIGNKKKALFFHKKCNKFFEMRPDSFISGQRGKHCFLITKTQEQFEKEIFNLVGNEYNVIGIYTRSNEKIIFQHNVCGNKYLVSPVNFLNGLRCPKCQHRSYKKTHEEFINELSIINPDFEILEEYISANTKIKVKHNKCQNIYYTLPSILLNGHGCQFCKEYKGEKSVETYLIKNNIVFKKQFFFNDCRDKYVLKFDFAVFKDNELYCLIEYDGEHHFKDVNFNGKNKSSLFKNVKNKDEIKNKYCIDNNIKLIRIPYFEFKNIEVILNKELGEII